MANWMVTAPIYGSATVFVEAESEEQARQKAIDGDWSESAEINEWEVSEKCGNFCHRTSYDAVRVERNE